jgi:Major Facilitator Superfamily
VLGLVQFMILMDITVVNVALPSIQHTLGFTATGLAWVVNGYALTAGGLLLLGGRLADLFSRRRQFAIGVGPAGAVLGISGSRQSWSLVGAKAFVGTGSRCAGSVRHWYESGVRLWHLQKRGYAIRGSRLARQRTSAQPLCRRRLKLRQAMRVGLNGPTAGR